MIVGRVREIWRFPVKSMAGEQLARADVGGNGIVGDRGWAVRAQATGEIHNAKRFPILMQCVARYRYEATREVIPTVDVELPDGSVVGSDSPDAAARLSAVLGRAVSLVALQPASNQAFYRRGIPGVAVVGTLSRSRGFRRLLQWTIERTHADRELRAEFGREPGEPLPDLSEVPATAFEYYTPPGTFFDLFPVHLITTSTLALMRRLNSTSDWDIRRFRPNFVVDTGAEPVDPPLEEHWCGRTLRLGGIKVRGEIPTIRCAMPTHAQRDLPRDPGVLRTIVRDVNQCLGLYGTVQTAGSIAVGDSVELA